MSFTRNIQPKIVLDLVATKLSCYVINYDGTTCTLYWCILDNSDTKIYEGNWNVPNQVISQWGTDDNIIIDALASAKGFELI